MRKRSGAIESDTIEGYIKLAVKSQEKIGLFYTEDNNSFEDSKFISQEKFVSNINNSNFIYEKAIEIFKIEERIEEKVFKENISEQANWQENQSIKVAEKQQRTIIKKIMVIGEKSSGKKSFINSFFSRMQKIKGNESPIKYEKNNCLDLISKNVYINDDEKIVFKFWIQNLGNEKFEEIINVYYKTIPFFIFVFDAQKKNSFEKIKKVIQNINTISKDKKLNGILVAINADTKIEYNLSEINELLENLSLKGLIKYSRGQQNDYTKLLELYTNSKFNNMTSNIINLDSLHQISQTCG